MLQRGGQLLVLRRLAAATTAPCRPAAMHRSMSSAFGQSDSGGRIVPLPGDATATPPPPERSKVVDGTQMQAVFLGYGVGQFELELLRGAPQLTDNATNKASVKSAGAALIEAASRFDLSYVPAKPAAPGGGAIRSSWATDKHATSSADPELRRRAAILREEHADRQAHANSGVPWGMTQTKKGGPSGEMGDPGAHVPTPASEPAADPSQPDPFAALVAAATPVFPAGAQPRAPVQSQASTPAAPAATGASPFPSQMRLIVDGSVVVYQNCLYCWSPKVHEDITVESLSFLRVITPRPELVLLGAGADISFRLGPDIMRLFEELRIGIEVMDSGNAIATYNILTDEGRTVLAAMLQKPEPKVVEYKPSRSELMRRKLGYWQFGKE